jgi:ATP-binding cassette subfamily B protein/ATP-binding cassette subfamily C protein LapB
LATRISLARAYLHPGNVLLIDELPNTLLSGKAGRNLKEYLTRAKGKRTVIICTYRDDYMKLADTIVWLRGLSSPIAGARDTMFEKINAGEKVA